MDKSNGELLALVLLTIGETSHAYSSFLPSHFTIRNWVLDGAANKVDENIKNLRSGYLPATGFGVGLGAAISYLSKSKLPLIASIIASAAMITLYERALPPELRLNPLQALIPSNKPSALPVKQPAQIGMGL